MLIALALAATPIWYLDYLVMTPGGTDMAKTLPRKLGHEAFVTRAECDAAGKEGVPYWTKHMVPELPMQPGWVVKYQCKLKAPPKPLTAAQVEAIHHGMPGM